MLNALRAPDGAGWWLKCYSLISKIFQSHFQTYIMSSLDRLADIQRHVFVEMMPDIADWPLALAM